MKLKHTLAPAMALVIGLGAVAAHADVAVVIEHQYTVGNDYFSAFAYNPFLSPHEFMTTGYGYGKDLRWSHVLDDSLEPWEMEGDVLLDSGQIEFFARDGYASYSLSYNAWGMNFIPDTQKYFVTCISILRDPANNNDRVASERDLIYFDPDLPNGTPTMPSGITVSTTGSVHSLVDLGFEPGDGFITRGVQPGDMLTLYPLHYSATIKSRTYTVTSVVSETELRLDKDPTEDWPQTSSVDNVSYIMMWQPWVTLGTFRNNIAYYDDDPDAGPKAHNKGGLSPDGTTLYLADIISDNLIAVDTTQPETFDVLVPYTTLTSYVQDQINAGRKKAIVNDDRAFIDSFANGYGDDSAYTTVERVYDPVAAGSRSLEVVYQFATSELRLGTTYDPPDDPERQVADYTNFQFYIHGGTTGGQEITLWIEDAAGVPGTAITLDPPLAGEWTFVEIPLGTLGLTTTVGDIVFDNPAAAGQPAFYLDDIGFQWTDPLPPGVGDYDVEATGLNSQQVHCDDQGRVWFGEGETDDLLWTTDGSTLNTFLRADQIVEAYVREGTVDPQDYTFSNGVQYLGLIIDDMGTVYWSDNQSRSIWKAPARDPVNNIIQLATAEEIKTALNITSSPRGLNCFSIRGTELLTFNFVDSNSIYKVDLNTFDYGDFDGDFDADLDDFSDVLSTCMAGPGETTPPAGCDLEDFEIADLDKDGDVDLGDYFKFQTFFTGG